MKQKLLSAALSLAAMFCLVFALSGCGTVGKVTKISLGDTREQVIKIMGTPDEEDAYTLGFYGGEGKKLSKRMQKLEEDFEKALEKGDTKALNEIMQESIEIEEKLSTLFFDYTTVRLNTEGLVTEVWYDAVYNAAGLAPEKTVKTAEVQHSKKVSYLSLINREVTDLAVKLTYTDKSVRLYLPSALKFQISGKTALWNWYSEGTEYTAQSSVSSKLPEGILMEGTYKNALTVTISDGVDTIPSGAFADCLALTEIVIPSSVTFIGSSAFSGCSNLTAVTFESVDNWTAKYILGTSRTTHWFENNVLSDPAVAAEYLTDTYATYEWSRS